MKAIFGFAKINLFIIFVIALSSCLFDFKNFNLAGVLKNKSFTMIVVPLAQPYSVSCSKTPPFTQILPPTSLSLVFENNSTLETAAILAKASPLNPNVLIESKSFTFEILLVACGKKAFLRSAK